MHEMVASEALPRHRDFVTKERKTMAAPCSGGLETTSGASFVDACEEADLSPEVLPNLSDCNQQKHVGLVVDFFSGTCRLSKACRKYGLRALPVD